MTDRIDPRTIVQGMLRPCCANERNLQTLDRFSPEHRDGMIVRQCRLCGRRHFEMRCDPGAMGVVGARM